MVFLENRIYWRAMRNDIGHTPCKKFYIDLIDCGTHIGSKYLHKMYFDVDKITSLNDITSDVVSYALSKKFAEDPLEQTRTSGKCSTPTQTTFLA